MLLPRTTQALSLTSLAKSSHTAMPNYKGTSSACLSCACLFFSQRTASCLAAVMPILTVVGDMLVILHKYESEFLVLSHTYGEAIPNMHRLRLQVSAKQATFSSKRKSFETPQLPLLKIHSKQFSLSLWHAIPIPTDLEVELCFSALIKWSLVSLPCLTV